MTDSASRESRILVVGAGAAAHRFVARLLRDPGAAVRVTVIGDESRGPYDRSTLARLIGGGDPAELEFDRAVFRDDRVRLVRDERVLHIDRARRTVRTRSRRAYAYDTLVLATGSSAGRVAVEGADLPGCFVFRTIDDVEAVGAYVDTRTRAVGRPLRATVIGAGVQGLQAAVALHEIGVRTTVVQYPERIMSPQLDDGAAAVLQAALERRGITVRTRTRTTRLDPDESGAVAALEFQDGSFDRTDIVVFTVGVRPRDELARNAGIEVHARGGVLIDERCVTSDPHILATGEVARLDTRRVVSGVGTRVMEEVAAAQVLGGDARLLGVDASLRATLGGVDVASFGEPGPGGEGVDVVLRNDRDAGVHHRLVLSDDARSLLGGVLVGDVGAYDSLRALVGSRAAAGLSAQLASAEGRRTDTDAGCEHIALSHARLMTRMRAAEVSTFRLARSRFGRVDCEKCTLTIARALTALVCAYEERGTTQTRSAVEQPLSRLRPDGTYMVRPRLPTGALAPDDLVALGRIAAEFHLQPRLADAGIELEGARPRQLSALIDRLRTVGLAPAEPAAHPHPHTRSPGAGENRERDGSRPRSGQGRGAVLISGPGESVSGAGAWGPRVVGAES